MIKYSNKFKIKIEHCYQCPYIKGKRAFSCGMFVLKSHRVSPFPKTDVPEWCPLDNFKEDK